MSTFRSTIATRSLGDCVTILNAAVQYDLLDAIILNQLLERCTNPANPTELSELSNGNLEMLSRILVSAAHSHQPETVQAAGQALLNELRNRLISIGYRRFFTNFIGAIRNLTLLDVYDLEIMTNLFNPEFLRFVYGKQPPDLQLYEIDGYNRINLKGIYSGPYLSDDYLEKVNLLYTIKSGKINRLAQLVTLIDAMKVAVSQLFEHTWWGYLLPFHLYPGN